ncbi:MAG: 30S ribosomal protein S6 [Verrucomicrobiales bacterium]|nr:30S ribosomal protein S6 [Verrucomicrobiales bacterium]MEC5126428.1 30S ribosomal protein S6 [Verrucomicrobiales bacterium BCK34]
MKRKYEGVYILKLQGQEEGIEEMVAGITKDLEAGGASLEQIDRLGRREFAHENNVKQKHGYYVQFYFEAEPEAVAKVEADFKRNEQIMLQYYRRR